MLNHDQISRKLVRPVDARGYRGIFSRGKPMYGYGGKAPNPKGKNGKDKFNPRDAIIRRYRGNNY